MRSIKGETLKCHDAHTSTGVVGVFFPRYSYGIISHTLMMAINLEWLSSTSCAWVDFDINSCPLHNEVEI